MGRHSSGFFEGTQQEDFQSNGVMTCLKLGEMRESRGGETEWDWSRDGGTYGAGEWGRRRKILRMEAREI